MKIKILWLGESVHSGFIQDKNIESAEAVNCSCGSNCWRIKHFTGGYSEILHEVELYTETRPFGYWTESILSSDDTGKIIESFRLVRKMGGELGETTCQDINVMLEQWNNYHKSKGHIWVNTLNLIGGYWRDNDGNTFELM